LNYQSTNIVWQLPTQIVVDQKLWGLYLDVLNFTQFFQMKIECFILDQKVYTSDFLTNEIAYFALASKRTSF
jgi:hypothetical protein